MSVCSRCPERADHIMLKCVRLRRLRAECFVPWDLSRTRPKWEMSQVLKLLASPKILALEDQEQEARNLDFWELTDLEDYDQQNGGHGQPLPLPAVPRRTHIISKPARPLTSASLLSTKVSVGNPGKAR